MRPDRDTDGPSHNARGLFVGGPQFVTPSDVLARLIAEAQGALTERHYAPNPHETRRAMRFYCGRALAKRRGSYVKDLP